MSQQCVNCELELNNDIMGGGVRGALYAQIIFAWLMSIIWPHTFIKNSRAAYMTATALLVASLIQWLTQDLSILDALVVSLMTSMMIIFVVVSGTSRVEVKPTTSRSDQATPGNASADPTQAPNTQSSSTPTSITQPVLARHQNSQQSIAQSPTTHTTNIQSTSSPVTAPQAAHPTPPSVQRKSAEKQAAAQAPDPTEPTYKPQRSKTQRFIRFCFINLWGGWCFNLWKDPAHFGLHGPRVNCTTNNEVIIWVFGEEVQAISPGMRITALVLVSILYFVAICSLFFTLEDFMNPAMTIFRSIGAFFTADFLKRDNATLQATTNRTLHEDPVINKIHYILHFLASGTLIYLIVSIENTIHRNDKKRATKEWSYGQVIALILLLQQVMDFCSTMVEEREIRQEKEEREERERQRIQQLIGANHKGNVPMKHPTPTTPKPAVPV